MNDRFEKHLKIKKVLSIVSIICFTLFILIQNLVLLMWMLDYSLDGTKGGFADVVLYLGIYLLVSLVYLIPQFLMIYNNKKLYKNNHPKTSRKTNIINLIDKRSKHLMIIWLIVMITHAWIIFIFAG